MFPIEQCCCGSPASGAASLKADLSPFSSGVFQPVLQGTEGVPSTPLVTKTKARGCFGLLALLTPLPQVITQQCPSQLQANFRLPSILSLLLSLSPASPGCADVGRGCSYTGTSGAPFTRASMTHPSCDRNSEVASRSSFSA